MAASDGFRLLRMRDFILGMDAALTAAIATASQIMGTLLTM